MSANYHVRKVTANLGTLDASGANAVVFAPGVVIDAWRLIFVTTIAHTTADAVLTVAVRDVDNGNSTTIGTVTLPFTGSAADDVQFTDLAASPTTAVAGTVNDQNIPGRTASVVYDATDVPVEVEPGQELSITSDGGGDAGTYQVYLQYFEQDFDEKNTDYTKLTFTFA